MVSIACISKYQNKNFQFPKEITFHLRIHRFDFNLRIFDEKKKKKLRFISLQVNDLISNNQLNICSEEKVFVAVLNWLKHDLTERKQHIAEVSDISHSTAHHINYRVVSFRLVVA